MIGKDKNAVRLNKFISEKGICSRREADRYITAGQVLVNGKKAQLGDIVKPGDRVMVNGQKLDIIEARKTIIIALNKPAGITSTTDTTDPSNIVDFVNYSERVFPIGRLDKDSQGLILLTNDGDIVNEILRAGNRHEKEYVVTVDQPVTDEFIRGMAGGVPVLGQVTKKCRVSKVTPMVFKIVLIQGLNRQIRRMCEYFGYQVVKLERVRIMDVSLKGIPPGDWRELNEDETASLLRQIEKPKLVVKSSAKTSEVPKKNTIPKSKKRVSGDKNYSRKSQSSGGKGEGSRAGNRSNSPSRTSREGRRSRR